MLFYIPNYNEIYSKLLNKNIVFGTNLRKLYFDNLHYQNLINNLKVVFSQIKEMKDENIFDNLSIIATTEKISINDINNIIQLINS